MVVTDAFQMIVIYAGIIALIVFGSSEVGGISQVWKIAQDTGRLKLDKYETFLGLSFEKTKDLT